MGNRSAGRTPASSAAARSDIGEANDDDPRNGYVTAFGRGLAVIRCFSRTHPSMTIAEVARAAGLNRATARRFLHTLAAEGYISSENGRYALRPRIMELGYAYLSSVAVDEFLQQRLVELADVLHEPCSAGVLDGHDVVFVARAETSHPRVMTLALKVGQRIPAYLTALGRVLLADLPDEQLADYVRTAELHKETERTIVDPAQLHNEILSVRKAGYCLTDQEIDVGVRAAAVPVRRPNKPTLAISTAIHANRGTMQTMAANVAPALLEAAAEIEQAIRLRN